MAEQAKEFLIACILPYGMWRTFRCTRHLKKLRLEAGLSVQAGVEKYPKQNPSASVEKRREVVLRYLIEYMGERQEDLISVHHSRDKTEVHTEFGSCPLKIYMCHQPDTIGIIIEGQPVVRGVPNLSKACCLLFGLSYALDLKYPSKMVYTFEIYQRLFVGLDPMCPKPSSKYANLLTKLS